MRRPLLVAIGMAWAATACTGTSDGAPVHETVPEGPPVDVPVEVTDEAPVPEAMLLGAGGVSQDEYLGDGGAVAIASAADGRITARWSDDQGKTWTGTTLPGDDYEDDGTLLLQQAGDHVLVLAQGEETTEERLSSPLIADDSGERVRPDTPNVVIRSDDGGRTWERSSLPIAGRLNTDSSLQVVGEGDLLAIVGEFGADPTLGWVSEDGGQTWRVLETSEDDERPDTIFHAAVRDGELRLWAVNGRDHPLLLRSDDAGATWSSDEVDDVETGDVALGTTIDGVWWAVDNGERSGERGAPQLRRSFDDGDHWETVDLGEIRCPAGLDDPYERMTVPTQAGALLVVTTSCSGDDAPTATTRTDVWASDTGGDHWTRLPDSDASSTAPLYPGNGGRSVLGQAVIVLGDPAYGAIVIEPLGRSDAEVEELRAELGG